MDMPAHLASLHICAITVCAVSGTCALIVLTAGCPLELRVALAFCAAWLIAADFIEPASSVSASMRPAGVQRRLRTAFWPTTH